jgi:predicted unusual protein kinase regulating ubiquinone biosynthesis (AarF/ABC1/UbiB family)
LASIGQCHQAKLKESYLKLNDGYNGGKVVAVKIMRPSKFSGLLLAV